MKKRAYIKAACPTLSVTEAAERLGADPMEIWELIHKGDCPGLRRLATLRIDESAMDEILEVLTDPEPD